MDISTTGIFDKDIDFLASRKRLNDVRVCDEHYIMSSVLPPSFKDTQSYINAYTEYWDSPSIRKNNPSLLSKLEREDDLCISRNKFDKDFLERYDVISRINTGSSGFAVYAESKKDQVSRMGVHLSENEIVAIKIIYKNRIPFQSWTRDEELGLVPSELSILKQINHPNIAKLLDFHEDDNFFYLVLECVAKGVESRANPGCFKPVDLHEFINSIGRLLSEVEIRDIFTQLVSAVHYLHSRMIVHADIKNENVTIDIDSLTIKLIDFGCAVKLDFYSSKMVDNFLGTLEYAAPESAHDGPYLCGPHIDTWSLGVILFKMTSGTEPFILPPHIGGSLCLHTIARSPMKRSSALISLISQLLEIEPSVRPSTSQIISHPWLSSSTNYHNIETHLIANTKDVPVPSYPSPNEISVTFAT